MLRVGVVFAWALLACQVASYGPGASGPSPSAPPPASGETSAAGESPSASSESPAPPSSAPGVFTMPDVSNVDSPAVAKKMILDAGLSGEIVTDWDDQHDHATELPCSTRPAAAQRVPRQFEAHLVMCVRGHNLVGMTVDAAKAEIARTHDLQRRNDVRVEVVQGNCASGTVCAVSPATWGTEWPDDAITLTVGK